MVIVKPNDHSPDLGSYPPGTTPLVRGTIQRVLTRNVRFEGKLTPRAMLVEQLLGRGWRVAEEAVGRCLCSPEGERLTERDITKTAIDYAAWLAARNPEPEEVALPDTDKEIFF